MNIMTKTNDGFKIADEDLKMRGPVNKLAKSSYLHA